MLHQNRAFLLILIFLTFSCTRNEKNDESYLSNNITGEAQIINFSQNLIGKDEYVEIRKEISDSIAYWIDNELSAYVALKLYPHKLDSVMCFNENRNKLITAILFQCPMPKCKQENIWYFYGVKIADKWYFFAGPTMVIPRDPKNSRIPASFTTLHEIAMDNIFKGYLNKSKESRKWEINDAFFSDFTSGAYGGKEPKTQAQWDSVYLQVVKKNWQNRDTTSIQ